MICIKLYNILSWQAVYDVRGPRDKHIDSRSLKMIERESFQNATTLFVKSRFTNDLAASLQHIKFLNSFKELTKFLSRPALKYFPTDTL